MEWGTPVQWGKFLLFCVLQSVKTKETNPTGPGSPTPCKQALSKFRKRKSLSCRFTWMLSIKRETRMYYVVVVQSRQRNVQKA